jgi:hypothetical protein
VPGSLAVSAVALATRLASEPLAAVFGGNTSMDAVTRVRPETDRRPGFGPPISDALGDRSDQRSSAILRDEPNVLPLVMPVAVALTK